MCEKTGAGNIVIPRHNLLGPNVDCSGDHAVVVVFLAAYLCECIHRLLLAESELTEVPGWKIVCLYLAFWSWAIANVKEEHEKEELPVHDVDRTEEELSEGKGESEGLRRSCGEREIGKGQ
jgi:hypothetical protein